MIRILLILSTLSAAASAEIPTVSYSLERAARSAVDNSAELQTATQNISIAEDRVLEARLRFLPDVGLQATATRFNARRPFALGFGPRSTLLFPSQKDWLYSGQGYILLPLYEGRRNINTLRLAQTGLKQARSQFDTVKLEVTYQAKKAFYRLLLAKESLNLVKRIKETVEQTAKRSDGNLWERISAQSLTADLRAAHAKNIHNKELAQLNFLKALNLELDRPVELEGSLETEATLIELGKTLVWATELRPELQSQTLRAEMDAIGVNLALGRRNPSVFLGFDYELTNEEFPLRQNNWDATVGIRLPFAFDFWTQRNQKIAEQRQAEIKRSELRDLVHLQVRKAHEDLLYWQKEWQAREQEYGTLTRLLRQAKNETAKPVDILNAAAGVLNSGQRHLEAIAEHILARARLERAVGRTLTSP